MQLWFPRTSEISIREQLAIQIILGIVSGELCRSPWSARRDGANMLAGATGAGGAGAVLGSIITPPWAPATAAICMFCAEK
ncbi:MAG TPA: hypothetical protein VFB00_01860 [Terriglobales bacterium]|nr:hypothetical protein [Terriglobales bacterium]